MDQIPKTGEFYRHFKDKLYQVVAVAEHTETGERMVVYQALYGDYKIYVRPLEMFTSEVDHQKYPRVSQKYRFERVELQAEKGSAQTGNPAWVQEAEGFCPEQKQSEPGPPARELNPHLLLFIEAETYDEKLEQLALMRRKITQEEMDLIYMSEDMKSVSGGLEEQLSAVEQYLLMQKRYEGGRLR